MGKLMDKTAIFALALGVYLVSTDTPYSVVPVLVTIAVSGALSYFEDSQGWKGIGFSLFILLCILEPAFLFFLPLICYDVFNQEIMGIWIVAFLPLLVKYPQEKTPFNWLVALLILVSALIKHRMNRLERLEIDYHRLRDNTKEISMYLEHQNKALLKKQDYEINLATVTERNRIARDIHDNVGHLLSRSILQVGALLATNHDEGMKEALQEIKASLSEAMDGIRTNVHHLYEESISLSTAINQLLKGFTLCPVHFDYHVESNPEVNIKYCFIAVTKEALSNMMRHSNATAASITLKEHPGLYQMIIQDNGSGGSYHSDRGIGIKNMIDRVEALGGNVHIGTEQGFRIFISIQKR